MRILPLVVSIILLLAGIVLYLFGYHTIALLMGLAGLGCALLDILAATINRQ
jgi:hypothetical protein